MSSRPSISKFFSFLNIFFNVVEQSYSQCSPLSCKAPLNKWWFAQKFEWPYAIPFLREKQKFSFFPCFTTASRPASQPNKHSLFSKLTLTELKMQLFMPTLLPHQDRPTFATSHFKGNLSVTKGLKTGCLCS